MRENYDGLVTYSANFDSYDTVTFWNASDYIGIDAFFPLVNPHKPTKEEVMKRWEEIGADLLAYQKLIGKLIVFTEIGYTSQDGTLKTPWAWEISNTFDPDEQFLGYETLYEFWVNKPEVKGVCFFFWGDPKGDMDLGYTPKGKLAEGIVKKWFY